MRHRVIASALLVVVAAACGGDGKITEPKTAAKVTPLAAIGTDPTTGATIETSQDDYVPGEKVHVTGRGWAPGETVSMAMTEDPDTHADVSLDVVADSIGAFSVHFYDVQTHDLGVVFTLTATGRTSGSVATAMFTDGRVVSSTTINGNAPPATINATTNESLAFVVNGSTNTISGTGNSTWLATSVAYKLTSPPGTTVTVCDPTDVYTDTNNGGTGLSVSFSAAAPSVAGTYTVVVRAHQSNDCGAGQQSSPFPEPAPAGQFTLIVSAAPTNAPPVLNAIGNKTVDELALLSFTATASDTDVPAQALTFSLGAGAPAGASITAGGAFTWTPTEAQGPGDYPVTVRVTDDGAGNLFDEETISIHVNEVNVAPVLASIGAKNGDELTLLTFTATATDADIPANTLTFSLDAGAPAGASITPAGVFTWTPTEAQGPGIYPITVRVTDNGSPNKSDYETISVTVAEVNVAPVLANIPAQTIAEGSLLTFTATATDADVPANALTFSLDAGAPAGASINPTTGEFSWTPTDGPASASVTVRVTDNGSPAMSDFQIVSISVTNVPPSITSGSLSVPLTPVAAGTNNVTVSWSFTDPGADTWACQVSWDTGLPYEPAAPTFVANPTKTCDVTATLPAGIYSITAKVSDDDGGSDTETATSYIVVYDPNAGFVTGGGWINSPAGAYTANLSLTGKATFGFVSKYKKGQTTPDGNTEFQFHAAGMNFKSVAYEWLVVAGAKAQFKGTGTINGVAGYGFMLMAIDGQVPGGNGADKFRIKIWELSNPTNVVYDNQVGSLETADPTTVLGGGSINIQAK